MSLLAWWKLNGDLLDSSGNDKHGTLVAGSTVSFLDDGIPMAKSANFSTGASFVEVPKDTIPRGTGDISISYWYKGVAAIQSSIIQAMKQNVGGDNVYYYQVNIHPRWLGDIMYCDIGSNEGGASAYDRFSFDANDTMLGWHHYVIVKNIVKGTIKVYKDGILFASGTGYTKYIGPVDRFLIGGGTTSAGANSYSLPSNLQDLRVYDHVLSTREIAELAKAKILHYTFDDVVDEPTTNLASTGTMTAVAYNTPVSYTAKYFAATSTNANGYIVVALSNMVLGKLYTISGKLKVNGNPSVFSKFINEYIGSVDILRSYTDPVTGEFIYTFYNNPPTDKNYLLHANVTGMAVGSLIEIFNLQVEEKDHATDFVDGARSSGVVKDKSEYSNHATIDGTTMPSFVSTCKLGEQGIKLATKKRIVEPLVLNPKPMTISFWFKANGFSSVKKGAYVVSNPLAKSYIILGDNSGNPDSSVKSLCVELGKTNSVSDLKMNILKGKEYYADNKWHNATIVIDGIDNRIFIDGIEEAVTFALGSKTILSGFCDTVCIGESTGSAEGFEPEGVFIDDFRIYATALSTEAIKDIYETRAYLDEKGLLVANKFEFGIATELKVKENGDLVYSAISDSGVTDGLIAWYPLDGHARDVVGGNDGTVVGATVVGGQMQKCYNFDGVDDYIKLNNFSAPKVMSYSCWVNIISYSGYLHLLTQLNQGNFGIKLDKTVGSEGDLYFYSSKTGSVSSGVKLLQNSWYNVFVVFENESIKFYLNGILIKSSAINRDEFLNAEFRIGNQLLEYSNMKIQDVRIYNRALTAAEVKINYEMSRPDGTSVMSVNNDILYVKSGISDKI